jgi:hypothetical protein
MGVKVKNGPLLLFFGSVHKHAASFLKKVAWGAGEQTRDLLISFIFSFHHIAAEPQRLPRCRIILQLKLLKCSAEHLL